jgi:Enoyl-(Acyl carrier protein) reductase
MAAYAASKAAVAAFTRCLGLELAAHGTRCNVVSPGSTDTPMLRALPALATGSADTLLDACIAGAPERFRVGIPLGRVAQPADIAEAVLFLLTDRARHITVQELIIDGGATLARKHCSNFERGNHDHPPYQRLPHAAREGTARQHRLLAGATRTRSAAHSRHAALFPRPIRTGRADRGHPRTQHRPTPAPMPRPGGPCLYTAQRGSATPSERGLLAAFWDPA